MKSLFLAPFLAFVSSYAFCADENAEGMREAAREAEMQEAGKMMEKIMFCGDITVKAVTAFKLREDETDETVGYGLEYTTMLILKNAIANGAEDITQEQLRAMVARIYQREPTNMNQTMIDEFEMCMLSRV